MKVHTATFVASSVSGIALIASLIGVFNIYSNVQSAWEELDTEMSSFKGATEDLWRDIQTLTGGSRQRRQTYGGYGNPVPSYQTDQIEPTKFPSPAPLPKVPGGRPGVPTNNGPPSIPRALDRATLQGGCQCKADNRCPAGPPGPQGVSGKPGPHGIDGKDGHPGKPALDYTPNATTEDASTALLELKGRPDPSAAQELVEWWDPEAKTVCQPATEAPDIPERWDLLDLPALTDLSDPLEKKDTTARNPLDALDPRDIAENKDPRVHRETTDSTPDPASPDLADNPETLDLRDPAVTMEIRERKDPSDDPARTPSIVTAPSRVTDSANSKLCLLLLLAMCASK